MEDAFRIYLLGLCIIPFFYHSFLGRPIFILYLLIFPTLILYRIKNRSVEIICNKCLRYTANSRFIHVLRIMRRCENCNASLEKTKVRGKVVLVFGGYKVKQQGSREFILFNPDFEDEDRSIDISEVYIDTKTTDKLIIERFIVYIKNHPPKYGLGSVQILYRGDINNLSYVKNRISANFKKVLEIVD